MIYFVSYCTFVLLFSGCIFISIMISTPPLYGWAEYGYVEEQYFCFCLWPKSPSYAFFMIIVCFGIPLTVMAICNILIYTTVRASKKRTARASKSSRASGPTISIQETSSDPDTQSKFEQENQKKAKNKKDMDVQADDIQVEMSDSHNEFSNDVKKRLSKMSRGKVKADDIRLALALAICIVCFFICWFPFCISMLLGIYSPDASPSKFHLATLLIGYSNSCMNPVIYGIVNRKIGEGFKDLFCRCQCRRTT